MHTEVLYPPTITKVTRPVIFLMGPIQGAPDWQARAIALLSRDNSAWVIANPRRSKGMMPKTKDGDFLARDYNAQVDWEHYYLELAARYGVTLCHLAKEEKVIPGRVYAQTTRFELGEVMTMHRFFGAKVVLGIEQGFSNERYIRRTFASKAPTVPVTGSLEIACETVLQYLSL